ncbi:MAG: hypothetical protein AB8E82_15915 [Aureispira sp.]
MEFNSSNILWIKNVKQVTEGEWAYDEKHHVNCNKPFQLHWSSAKAFGGNAKRANVGDIIVLFQKPREIDGKRNTNIYLTHLVTPITKDVSNGPFPKHKHCRQMKLIAMADPINAICVTKLFKFSKVGRGFTNNIKHLLSKEGLKEDENNNEIKNRIWDLFLSRDSFC